MFTQLICLLCSQQASDFSRHWEYKNIPSQYIVGKIKYDFISVAMQLLNKNSKRVFCSRQGVVEGWARKAFQRCFGWGSFAGDERRRQVDGRGQRPDGGQGMGSMWEPGAPGRVVRARAKWP